MSARDDIGETFASVPRRFDRRTSEERPSRVEIDLYG